MQVDEGSANYITVGFGGKLVLEHGGTAISTFVCNNGSMRIEGGSANYVTVGSGGSIHLKVGGVATNVDWTPTIGEVSIQPGTVITFASSLSGVYLGDGIRQPKHSSFMKDEDIGSMTMVVMSGGTADNCSVGPSGGVSVWSGGSVSRLKVTGGELIDRKSVV